MNIDKLHKIGEKQILVFGDYMIDHYIIGDVSRISPEAPVPVVEVEKEQTKLGGAGNVVNNLISLGAKVRVLGCVGDDVDGEFIENYFENQEVDITYFRKYRYLETIKKTRIVSKKQQFVRVDKEEIMPLPDDYYELISNNINNILKNISAVIISDYGKGSVTKKFCKLVIENAKNKDIPIIVDPKGTDYTKYEGATICTPNTKEFELVTNVKMQNENDFLDEGIKLSKKLDLKYLMITRSEKGISLITDGKKIDFPAKAKEVIDVSGAGDTVVSSIAIFMALGYSIDEVCKLANAAASVVVSKFGTSTLSVDELISSISENSLFKLVNKVTAKSIVDELKFKGKKIVFTNGCFDLLHAGHLSSFKQAKEFGDILIVAVNSDKSVKKNKGDLRPIISEQDRIDMLCALEIIDYVILMEEDNPVELIKELEPDVCVKGSDWKDKEIPEKSVIAAYGGELKFIKLEKDKSTTNIINKILKVYENE